jgi:hypothetical protein
LVVRSRLRFAAGVCILAAGVLMGGGAVAVADPGLGGSAPNGDDDGTNKPIGPTVGSPVGTVTNTVRDTIQGATGRPGSGAQPGQRPSTGATSTLGSGRQPGQQPSTGAIRPKIEAGGTDEAQEDAGLVTADPNPVAAVPNVAPPVTDAVAAPVPDAVVAPVTDAVAPVTTVLAPASDVIAPGHDTLTLVAGAVVPLTQLPSDLSHFMLGIAGVAPAGDGSGGVDGTAPSAAAGASVAPQLPRGPPVAHISGVPGADNATRVARLDVILLGRASALSGLAPRTSNGASLIGAESSFRNAFDEFLLVASLWMLAAVALPGLGGLVILTVVGVRIQYGSLKSDSHRKHRALRASPVPRAVKRWMSAR